MWTQDYQTLIIILILMRQHFKNILNKITIPVIKVKASFILQYLIYRELLNPRPVILLWVMLLNPLYNQHQASIVIPKNQLMSIYLPNKEKIFLRRKKSIPKNSWMIIKIFKRCRLVLPSMSLGGLATMVFQFWIQD